MAHNIDMSNEQANLAWIGEREDIWHRMGQEMKEGMSTDAWAKAAGLDWEAFKAPALAQVPEGIQGAPSNIISAPDYFLVRNDTFQVISDRTVTNRYQIVQPRDVLAWFEEYISVDDRFVLDVAGSLNGGSIIWATALYRDDLDVAGDKHRARVLMSTTYDGSGATVNQCTMTRVVCNNTLNAAHGDKRAVVRTRHNTKFDKNKVGRELATLAKGFETYAKVGEALAEYYVALDTKNAFFKSVLDIDTEVEKATTRKKNQYAKLQEAYNTSVSEGCPEKSGWAILQACLRYVDHDRPPEFATDEKVLGQTQFGSGNVLKARVYQSLIEGAMENNKELADALGVA